MSSSEANDDNEDDQTTTTTTTLTPMMVVHLMVLQYLKDILEQLGVTHVSAAKLIRRAKAQLKDQELFLESVRCVHKRIGNVQVREVVDLAGGNYDVILCERGIRTFESDPLAGEGVPLQVATFTCLTPLT
jgi:hypothetical protein